MQMTKTLDKTGTGLTIELVGRLDTNSASQFEADFEAGLDGIKDLVLDMTDLVYISSAGLRLLLKVQKVMNKQGTMIVKNINQDIRDIFEVTGFDQLLNIE